MQENRIHPETLDFQGFAQHRAAEKTKDEQIPQFAPTLKVAGSNPVGRTVSAAVQAIAALFCLLISACLSAEKSKILQKQTLTRQFHERHSPADMV
ncbi:MAG: hypothetical protein IJA83_11835 [Clostridia bacterium]|nr:hypothetical protein [Clostridia bacterium]